MKQEITDHAEERVRKRVGIPRKAVKKNAEIALEKGVTHKECSGRLKKYVDYLYLSHRRGNNIRLWGDHVYIFTTEKLITVFPIPKMYRNAVHKILSRRENNNE
jgi:hypothetical protein